MAENEETGANLPPEDNGCAADSASAEQSCCGTSKDAGSDCCSGGSKGMCFKGIIFGVVMLAAVAVAAYAIFNDRDEAGNGLASGTKVLSSLTELNDAAVDKDVVFVLLAGEDQQSVKDAAKRVDKVVADLTDKGKKVGFFTMRKDAKDYDHLAAQFAKGSFPCVAVLGIGCMSSGVTGEITTEKLQRAFVLASTPVSGCGPTSPGGTAPTCGPSGCGN